MAPKARESDDTFILERLAQYGVKQVRWAPGARKVPAGGTPAYLDFLDRHALEIVLGHHGAPRIVREGAHFVLKREKPERKFVHYGTARSALMKVLCEQSAKDWSPRDEMSKD